MAHLAWAYDSGGGLLTLLSKGTFELIVWNIDILKRINVVCMQ